MPSLRVATFAAAALALVAVMTNVAGCGFDGVATSEISSNVDRAGLDGGRDGAPAAPGSDASVDRTELTLTSEAPAAQVDLEVEGTLAWTHWGTNKDNANSRTQKASASGVLPTFTVTGSTDTDTFEDNFTTFRWTNGVPVANQSGTRNGVYAKGTPKFQLSRLVGTERQRFVLYAGIFRSKSLLTVVLGTGPGARSAVATLDGERGYARFVIDHRANDPATPLIITWELTQSYDNSNANLTLVAATLAPRP